MGRGVRSLLAATVACLMVPVAATAAAGTDSDEAARGPSAGPTGRTPVPAQLGAGRPETVPGELLVRFRAGATARDRAAVRAGVGARLLDRLPVPGLELLHVGADRAAATARVLGRRPDVLYAEPNYVARTTATSDDPRFGQLWGLHNTGQTVQARVGTADADIDAPEAWDHTTGRSDVTVAVVDSGVAIDHPDLAGNVWTNSAEAAGNGIDDDGNGYVDDVHGWDWVDGDADPHDLNGHGTHVAGTVGGVGGNGVGVTGVAWDVSLMPLRALDAEGAGSYAAIIAAFKYAAANGADVVNASLGGSGSSQSMADAIATSPGTLFVVAAGNAATDNEATPEYPCNYAAVNLVCAAATDNSDDLATFSNYGTTSVDLAAPGVSVVSAVPPAERTVWSERFEDGGDWLTRWSTGGTSAWQRQVDGLGGFISDSPGGDYAPNANTWVQGRTPLNLSGHRRCTVDFALGLRVEPGYDWLVLEGSADQRSWTPLSSWSDDFADNWYSMRAGLGRLDGGSSVYLRFRLASDELEQRSGAAIDDIEVACQQSYDGTEYAYLKGTSMASPHVAGAAALLYAAASPASAADRAGLAAEVRDALLQGVDPVASLSCKTVTGGRLNVRKALDLFLAGQPAEPPPPTDCTAPETTIDTAPPDPTAARTAALAFGASEGGSSFACSLDGEPFTACASPVQYSALSPGAHEFAVRAQDGSGNLDESPAVHRWTVDNTPPNGVRVGGFPTPVTIRNRLPLRFSADDADDAIDHFQVRRRTARYDGTFGAWSTIDTGVAARTSLRVRVPTGHTVCYAARASDEHGATSAWSPSRCTVVPLDDRAATRSAGWGRTTDAGAFRGTLSVASRRGSSLTVPGAAVRRVALVATKAPGSGTVEVYLGRTLLERVSLTAARTRKRRLVPVATWARTRTGNVRVVVTTSGKPVRVDGLALGR